MINDKKTGWLSPDGSFYPCEYGEHEYKAEEISGGIDGFIFGFNITPQYSATYSNTLEVYGYIKIQDGVLFVPDNNWWDDELFVKKSQYDWLSKNIDLARTIPLRIWKLIFQVKKFIRVSLITQKVLPFIEWRHILR